MTDETQARRNQDDLEEHRKRIRRLIEEDRELLDALATDRDSDA